MSRFIVTGGAGFVGSHLVDRLLGDGHQVVAIDNLVTGTGDNVRHVSKEPRFELIQADISEKFPDIGSFDGIFHLASPASPVDFVPLAIPILKVGSYGSFHALEAARAKNAWILVASTSEVYGDPQEHPQREEYFGNVNPIGIRGVYDEAKRFMEAVTMTYRRTHKLSTSIVRIFNTYGPRMRPNDGRVIPNFINQALTGKALTINGDGLQTRSLCYVDDLVDGIVRFAAKRPSEPINLGNNHEVSVKTIAEIIIKLTNSKSKLTYQPLPEGDPKQRCPNIDRARKILSWEPKITIEDGLTRTIDYFRTIL